MGKDVTMMGECAPMVVYVPVGEDETVQMHISGELHQWCNHQ